MVNITSGNGLLPADTTPLPELTLTYHHSLLWHSSEGNLIITAHEFNTEHVFRNYTFQLLPHYPWANELNNLETYGWNNWQQNTAKTNHVYEGCNELYIACMIQYLFLNNFQFLLFHTPWTFFYYGMEVNKYSYKIIIWLHNCVNQAKFRQDFITELLSLMNRCWLLQAWAVI